MKPFSKQTHKWILSSLMVAALGSQYYFSISSISMGSFELASKETAAEELKRLLAELDANQEASKENKEKGAAALRKVFSPRIKAEMDAVKPQHQTPQQIELEVRKSVESREAAEKAAKEKTTAKPEKIGAPTSAKPAESAAPKAASSETEASSSTFAVFCTACTEKDRWIVLPNGTNRETAEKIGTALKNVELATAKPEVKKEEESKKDDHGFETVAERRKREREEAQAEKEEKKRIAREKKEDARQAKEDKLREDKKDRTGDFKVAVSEIVTGCEDSLTCKVDRFTSLMRKYSGSKNVESYEVMRAYNQIIDKDLKAGLRGEDGSEGKNAALAAIENLIGEIPAEYRSLKIRTVDSVKAAQIAQASAINGLYRQAEVYRSQNKTEEYLKLNGRAIHDDQTFRQEENAVYHSMFDPALNGKDRQTLDYITNNYVNDMRGVLSRLSNLSGISAVSESTGTGNRSGRTGNTTINNGGATIQNTGNNSMSGVIFKQESKVPTQKRPAVQNRTGLVK